MMMHTASVEQDFTKAEISEITLTHHARHVDEDAYAAVCTRVVRSSMGVLEQTRRENDAMTW